MRAGSGNVRAQACHKLERRRQPWTPRSWQLRLVMYRQACRGRLRRRTSAPRTARGPRPIEDIVEDIIVGTADIPPGQQGHVFADKQLKDGRAGVADGVDADALPGHVLRPTTTSNTASPSTPCRRGEASIAREPWRAARTTGSE